MGTTYQDITTRVINKTFDLTTKTTHRSSVDEGLFDDEMIMLLDLIISVVVCGTISLLGVISNIINLIVFHRQGIFTSSAIVNLAALSLCDLMHSSIRSGSMLVYACFEIPQVYKHIHRQNFLNFGFSRPTIVFTQISSWLMVFASFERVCSVVFPFKVKQMFSPKRSIIAAMFIFVSQVMLHIPLSFQKLPALIDQTDGDGGRNASSWKFLTWEMSNVNSGNSYFISLSVNLIAFRSMAIIFVILFNAVIAWKVKKSQEFRKGESIKIADVNRKDEASINISKTDDGHVNASLSINTARNHSEKIPKPISCGKEMTLLKMIRVVSLVFAGLYSYEVVYFMFYLSVEITDPAFQDLIEVLGFVSMIFESVNTSVNMLVYYRMSSRYRQEFQILFKAKSSKQDSEILENSMVTNTVRASQ